MFDFVGVIVEVKLPFKAAKNVNTANFMLKKQA